MMHLWPCVSLKSLEGRLWRGSRWELRERLRGCSVYTAPQTDRGAGRAMARWRGALKVRGFLHATVTVPGLQTQWLKTTESPSLLVLEARSLSVSKATIPRVPLGRLLTPSCGPQGFSGLPEMLSPWFKS